MSDALRQIQDAILATDPQDVQTIELLKEQYARARAVAAGAQTRAPTPAGAAGAPTGGQSTGDLPSPRTAASVLATAPAKAMAGGIDLGQYGLRTLLQTTTGVKAPELPKVTPMVDRLTDTLAGQPVENSVGRSAFEGAVMGPLSGGKTAAQIIPQMAAGGAGAGAADAANRSGAHPLVSALLGVGAGVGAGKVAGNVGLTPAEMLAKGRVQKAGAGVTPDQFREGAAAQSQAQREGVQLLPSQALQTDAAGFEELQRQLLASRAGKADGFRADVLKQQGQVQMMIERLRAAGGQTPRSDDELAAGVQRISKDAVKAEGDAINAATRHLYNAPDSKAPVSPRWASVRANQLENDFNAAIEKHRSEPLSVAALVDTKERILGLLRDPKGNVTPEELNSIIAFAKADLPVYSDMKPSLGNLARKRVSDSLAFLEGRVEGIAPSLGEANRIQRELRQNQSTGFSEVVRQGKTGTGTEGALNAATARPEVMGAVQKADPRLAQELLQRQLNGAVDRATATNATTNLPAANSGIVLKKALTEGLQGKEFQRNLDMLFPGKPDEAVVFRQRLDVAANASKPRGDLAGASNSSPLAAQEIAIKGTRGLTGQIDYVLGGLTRALAASKNRLSDDAVISILQKPDVIERLAKLSALPAPRLTRAAFVAAVPQLFEEEAK